MGKGIEGWLCTLAALIDDFSLSPRVHVVVHNHLKFQFQGTGCCVDTVILDTFEADIHEGKTPIHTKINKYFLKASNQSNNNTPVHS